MKFLSLTLIVAPLAHIALAAKYSRTAKVVGNGFNTFFNYQNITDPTGGFVDYVDKATAQTKHLSFYTDSLFVIRADHTNVYNATTSVGRPSVRLKSTKTFTTHVAVFSITHMPTGCGTWPSVWEAGANSPTNGEVDIIEGVNTQTANYMTLHTSRGCTIPSPGTNQTGAVLATDCGATTGDIGYHGCVVQSKTANSYGAGFNQNIGGVYAMERTKTFIKIWFWPNRDKTLPSDAAKSAKTINTTAWGTPTAYFPNTYCDFNTYFGPNNILLNVDICGRWAGADSYDNYNCPGTCDEYAAENPDAFQQAYFAFAFMNIYE